MRIAYALELVAAFAVGSALARTAVLEEKALRPERFFIPEIVEAIVWSTLSGVVLVEGPCLWVEAWRGRTPPNWGIGRWTWSAAAILLILEMAWKASDLLVLGMLFRVPMLWFELCRAAEYDLRLYFPFPFVAICGTCLIARRWPRDPSADSREWAGRVFATAVIISFAATESYRYMMILGVVENRPTMLPVRIVRFSSSLPTRHPPTGLAESIGPDQTIPMLS